MTGKSKAYVFIGLSALGYSVQTIFGKILLNSGLSPGELTCLEYTVGTVITIGIALVSRNKRVWTETKANFKYLALISLLSVTLSQSLYMALNRLNAGITSMLMFTNPVLICLFFIVTHIKPITRSNKIALAASFAGSLCVLDIAGQNTGAISPAGVAFGMTASTLYAAYSIIYDLKLSKLSSYTTLTACLAISTVMAYMINFRVILNFPHISSKTLIIVILATAITVLIPAYFLYAGIGIIGSEKASVASTAELPLTMIIAFFVLGESLKAIQIVGVVLIVGAIFILQKEG